MIVHTLFSDSPDTLSQVKAALLPGDAVLLAGDGCYLTEDAQVRGINETNARLISDPEWVTLTADSQQVISWF